MPNVWATSTAAPSLTACEDARVLGEGRELHYPEGTEAGQAGWDVGTGFTDFVGLANNLANIRKSKGQIARLAINLHGREGVVDADGKGKLEDLGGPLVDAKGYPATGKAYNMPKLREKYSVQLREINATLTPDAVVLFVGCTVALGKHGETFLSELSKEFFAGKKVVGFTTVQFATTATKRVGAFCSNPGSLDSDYTTSSFDNQKVEAERYKTLVKTNWVSERSKHAKIALNGVVTGEELEKEPEKTDYSPQNYLPGTWNVTMGQWNGWFRFSKDGACSWSDVAGGASHKGTWKVVSGEVQWTYSDDNKGWERLFHAVLPLKTNVNGDVTIKGVKHGFYGMSKTF